MITTLEEAIAHAKEVAEKQRKEAGAWEDMCYREKANLPPDYKICLECAKDHEQLAEWLTELKERRERDSWIPVSERLPEEGNMSYLVTVDYGDGIRSSCQRFFFNDELGWNDDCVIAWKPLPKPYESEDK